MAIIARISSRKTILIILLVAFTAGIMYVWRSPSRFSIASRACERCNVLLITIDTLRGDRIRGFGGDGNLTPHLDRFAAEGLRLTRAYASAPLTLPSHATILTAATPPVHGLRTNGLFRLDGARPTLATVLRGSGYRTAAFVGAFVLDARFGLGRGFDVYDDRYGERRGGDATEGAERRAEDVMKPALAWIAPGTAAPGTPWFAWLHLYDPHEPYRAPEPWASQYPPYDAEVAYVDAQIGHLRDALAAAGALDRTVVIIVADHGESLGEHGERTHGVFTYDVTMRVPWILWAGSRLHGASSALVRLTDLAPTVLDLVGVAPAPEFQGLSLIPLLTGHAESAPAYLEAMDANLTRNWAPLTAVVSGAYKLIDLPIPELYDLNADPRETVNIFSREAERARALDRVRRTAADASSGPSAARATLSAESRQRLQALGYAALAAPSASRRYTEQDDPKTLIQPANELNDALALFRRGGHAEALAAAQTIVHRYPSFTTARGIVASMQHDSGDLQGAIATLDAIARQGVADQSVLVVLAGYLREAGAIERAAALLEAVVHAHPDYADAYNSLGVVYSAAGDHARAQTAFLKVIELDPSSATAYENLGVDDMASNHPDAAVTHLSRALDLDPGLAGAHNALAVILKRRGDFAGAVEHWTRALDSNPQLFDALYNLGIALADAGRREQARPYLERFAREASPHRYAADIAHVRRLLSDNPP
jgi:arylsulfatase A-like enzyme/Flp pilus assembly protein TadD